MSLTETYDRVATNVEAQLLAAWESWQDGLITEAEFRAVALAYLAAGAHRGTAVADAALAAYLSAATGTPVPALGLTPEQEDYTPELDAALADPEDTGGRVGRTGRAVVLAAAQAAYGTAMLHRGVPHWTRVLNSGACELCQDLAGDVLPASARMYHHTGCGCTQRPVLNHEGTPA